MEPITFQPVYKERVWGGRSLETLYGRTLPCDSVPYGESWEMTDREGGMSVVLNGKYKGMTLNTLWLEHREEIFGSGMPDTDRFPLLIKILDAEKDLSVQVHPTAEAVKELGGEPKTEMWYIAEVRDDAQLYVGVKEGISKSEFSDAIQNGTVEDCIHAITPKVSDSIHIEAGRLHAIGAGVLIYEIQQNSDTTFRVFDWNRVGLNGKPRQLHVEESIRCIDFSDVEPEMDRLEGSVLSDCVHFRVDKFTVSNGGDIKPQDSSRFAIITVVTGVINNGNHSFKVGDFFLLPLGATPLTAQGEVTYLETVIPV